MISSKPFQYIKGWVEFYKLKFKVTPDVLIPRPESELLVDEVIRFANHPERSFAEGGRVEGSLTILDVGTGSGNIAISLACNLRGCNVKIIASDISEKALQVAKQNAKLHGVSGKIEFVKSNLLSNLNYTLYPTYTLIIVTNLPYIPTQRIPYLDSSVKDFEPHIALDGGEDGFSLYRKLFKQIMRQPSGLQPKLLVCEIDYTHGELAINEAQKYFPDAEIEVKTDLAKKQRILLIRGFSNGDR